jgi:ubiquinone/menaquinone biosynthesis C-methylase UbiE
VLKFLWAPNPDTHVRIFKVMSSQKDIFLNGEGNQYFFRNNLKAIRNFPELKHLSLYLTRSGTGKFLDIGCGAGQKTVLMHKMLGWDGIGVDPSDEAIKYANTNFSQRGLEFEIGTADDLNFPDDYFDLISFSFCLYLVDRNLMPTVIRNTNRMVKTEGFISITDFDVNEPRTNQYHHDQRVTSFKDNYSQYFLNMGYNLVLMLSQLENGELGHCIDEDKRISTTLLRKIN